MGGILYRLLVLELCPLKLATALGTTGVGARFAQLGVWREQGGAVRVLLLYFDDLVATRGGL